MLQTTVLTVKFCVVVVTAPLALTGIVVFRAVGVALPATVQYFGTVAVMLTSCVRRLRKGRAGASHDECGDCGRNAVTFSLSIPTFVFQSIADCPAHCQRAGYRTWRRRPPQRYVRQAMPAPRHRAACAGWITEVSA